MPWLGTLDSFLFVDKKKTPLIYANEPTLLSTCNVSIFISIVKESNSPTIHVSPSSFDIWSFMLTFMLLPVIVPFFYPIATFRKVFGIHLSLPCPLIFEKSYLTLQKMLVFLFRLVPTNRMLCSKDQWTRLFIFSPFCFSFLFYCLVSLPVVRTGLTSKLFDRAVSNPLRCICFLPQPHVSFGTTRRTYSSYIYII